MRRICFASIPVLAAIFAVLENRGSTTVILPPLSRIAFIRPGQSGAVASEPFETIGSAPRISR